MKKILVLTLFMSWNAWGDLEVRCINGQQQKVDTRTGLAVGPPLGSVCSSQTGTPLVVSKTTTSSYTGPAASNAEMRARFEKELAEKRPDLTDKIVRTSMDGGGYQSRDLKDQSTNQEIQGMWEQYRSDPNSIRPQGKITSPVDKPTATTAAAPQKVSLSGIEEAHAGNLPAVTSSTNEEIKGTTPERTKFLNDYKKAHPEVTLQQIPSASGGFQVAGGKNGETAQAQKAWEQYQKTGKVETAPQPVTGASKSLSQATDKKVEAQKTAAPAAPAAPAVSAKGESKSSFEADNNLRSNAMKRPTEIDPKTGKYTDAHLQARWEQHQKNTGGDPSKTPGEIGASSSKGIAAPAAETGATKSLAFRDATDAAAEKPATVAEKPAGSFSDSIKKGNEVPVTGTDKMVADALNGKANQDLGTIPGLTPTAATPAQKVINLGDSSKNIDGSPRSPASVTAPAKAAKPVLTETEIKLNKVNSDLREAKTKQETAHREYLAADENYKTAKTKVENIKNVEIPKAAEADKKDGVKPGVQSKMGQAMYAQKNANSDLAKADNDLLTAGKNDTKANEEVSRLTKEQGKLAKQVKGEKREKEIQASGPPKAGEPLVVDTCDEACKAGREAPVAATPASDAKTCSDDLEETTLPQCPKSATAKPTCSDDEKKANNGTCLDKAADAGKKPTCDANNKPEGCEPAKADAKPKVASAIPDSETYCLCGEYNEQTKSCAGAAQAPETPEQRKARRAAKASGNSSAKNWSGSSAFKQCVADTEGKIVDFGAFKTQKSWQEVLCADPENKGMTGAGFHDEIADHRECAMAFYILKQAQRDSNNPDHLQPVIADAKGDPYKCKSAGLETIDYDDCVAFGDHVQAAEIAKKVATEVQGAKYAMDMQDEQLKASKSPDQATAALTSQKTSFELQQQMMNQQAIVDGGTAALLGNDKSNMPNFETLQTWCQSIQNSPLSGNDLGIDTKTCTDMINAPAKFAFLQNQKASDAMTKKIWEIGAATAIDLLKANMLGKQAEQVGNAIAAIKGITPLAPTGPTMADMKAELCQLAPTDPGCTGGPGLSRTFGSVGNDTINFGNGGQGSIYSPGTLNPDTTAGGGGGTALGTPNIKGTGATNTTVANNPGGLKDTAAAAQFDNKGGAASGGGGGGGGATGGGGGGGGGGPTGGGAGGGVQSAVAGKAPGYGGGGGFSMMGGFGIKNGGKTADTGNPFGKMFDKGPKGDMNFRAPASAMGNKNDNIFEMITKRYNNVSTDKRLMEYEQAK